MTDDRSSDSYNPPVDTGGTPGEGGNDLTNEPGNNAAPGLDATLGMDGGGGGIDTSDTDMAGDNTSADVTDP
ncbi:hypothetical protein [Deinococcus planocerae]|uniref:hypothetical protein n=1 Tax=Deinococcus planocerae TaxID=1737569 RepID=UPI000C7F3A9C|nr:hypothetical protein [Deinococcus planocerae]